MIAVIAVLLAALLLIYRRNGRTRARAGTGAGCGLSGMPLHLDRNGKASQQAAHAEAMKAHASLIVGQVRGVILKLPNA